MKFLSVRYFFILLLSMNLVACSSVSRESDTEIAATPAEEVHNDQRRNLAVSLPSKSVSPEPLSRVPMVMNPQVKKWMRYFQGRGKGLMTRYLQRSARYVPMMKEILRSHGLPEELVYIALIESGFTSRAYSPMGAVGYWQFMRGTAKDFGLKVDRNVDERRDPVKSTHAAARYLKGVYNVFGSWYLAIASYNVGHNKLKGVVMRNHTRDFWELVRRKKLPSETLNYVPKFLAAWLIAEQPKKYGFNDVKFQDPIVFDEILTKKPLSLSKLSRNMRVSLAEMRRLNPAIKGDLIPLGHRSRTMVRVPKGQKTHAYRKLAKSVYKAPRHIPQSSRGVSTHRVRAGDTLTGIARKYRTSLTALRQVNRLGRKSIIRIGSVLKIPQKAAPKVALKKRKRLHKISRGETLLGIARKYGTTLDRLRRANNLRRRAKIYVGRHLVIPL